MDRRDLDACDIEIVERTRQPAADGAGSIVVPNEIRINGRPVFAPKDDPVIVHDVTISAHEPVRVTLTLFARSVTVRQESTENEAA